MPSKSRISFDENAKDIKRLLDLHKDKGGIAKGRRHGLEVLNKSAIVLLTSFWEAYCEDIAAEALEHLVAHSLTADKLPTELRRLVAKELKEEKHELAIWKLSDTGWRAVLKGRLSALQKDRNRHLNTPKTAQIDKLFLEALGIPKISDGWYWPKKMTVSRATSKLDKYVELRGAIAHRGVAGETVKKSQVTDYFKFLKNLVSKTGGGVYRHVRDVTGKTLWK